MKTRELLPKPLPETDEMTEDELKAHLLQYKQYKELSVKLEEIMNFWGGAIYRAQENIDFPKKEETITLSDETLAENYSRAKLRFDTLRNDNKEKMETILKIERVSLKDKIKQIVSSLVRNAKVKFSEIFNKEKNSKPEVVTGFMATLELNKRNNVKVHQDKLFGEIEIECTDKELSEELFDLDEYKEWE